MVKRSVLHIQSIRQTRDQTRAELALTREAARTRISTLEGSVKTKSVRVRDLTAVSALAAQSSAFIILRIGVCRAEVKHNKEFDVFQLLALETIKAAVVFIISDGAFPVLAPLFAYSCMHTPLYAQELERLQLSYQTLHREAEARRLALLQLQSTLYNACIIM